MTHTKMAFASRDYSFQGPTQSSMHDAWSQRLVQDTNTMALLTSAESTKMSCKQLKASDNRLQKMSNISINQCMQLLHVLELEKAACQPSALWVSSRAAISLVRLHCQGGPASATRPWPTKGTARRCHRRRGSGRKPGWSWDAAWDECHGVGKET